MTRLALLVSFCLGALFGGVFLVVIEYVDGRWARVATTLRTTTGEQVRCFTLTVSVDTGRVLCAKGLKDAGFLYRSLALGDLVEITVRPEAAR